MDRRYSPITDLYGTVPQNTPPRRSSHTGLYFVLAVVGFFLFMSIQPKMRLRPDPPPSVVGARLNKSESHYRSQLRMARACWTYAIESVQDLYPYGKSLPRKPPAAAHSRTGSASALSEFCWPRLRNAWTHRQSWKWSFKWSTKWLTNPESPFRQTVNRIMNALGINL